MAEHSKIEWTDATWNPITGCFVVSPGCTNCYAMRLAGTRLKHHWSRIGLTRETKAGPVWTGEVRLNEEWLTQPLQWRRPRRIFVCAHGDLFHPGISFEVIAGIFGIMNAARRHTMQVLTKRPDRMRAFFAWLSEQLEHKRLWVEQVNNAEGLCGEPKGTRGSERHPAECIALHAFAKRLVPDLRGGVYTQWPLPNVWLGVSAEDQRRADERREDLAMLATAGWTTFVSYEPALGPVDWTGWEFLSWLISGGENGPRPSHPDWHRTARDFCSAHGVPYLFKQWGSWLDERDATRSGCAPGPSMFDREGRPIGDRWHFYDRGDVIGGAMIRVGKSRAGRLLDGVEHNGMPAPR